jgi:hypothetical protein
MMSNGLQETLEAIERMRGWGGTDENDPYPNAQSLSNAKGWVREAYGHIVGVGLMWMQPNITLDESGNVCFEWWASGSNAVAVYVDPAGVFYLIFTEGINIPYGLPPDGKSLNDSIEAVEWIIKEKVSE